LLRSAENVGPYRLNQSVIGQTAYDAYLFQDADDWCTLDRLELLLEEAEKSCADWVGTQELMYQRHNVEAFCYPKDVNESFKIRFHYQFCHPSSLVSRDLVSRLGGYSAGLRFSGDFEFFTRAVFSGRTVNLDRYCYFRRIRKGSLLTSAESGLASAARRQVDGEITQRALENMDRFLRGRPLRLQPLRPAEPVALEHVAGPPLRDPAQ